MKKQILFYSFLLIIFCAAPLFAQGGVSKDKIIAEYKNLKEKILSDGESQCEMYGTQDFSGRTVSINAANAKISDFLKEITKQTGLQFEIDKSVGQVFVTANANNAPWNRLLNTILEMRGLAAKKNCPVLRIVKSKNSKEKDAPFAPILTETVKLKNLELKEIRRGDAMYFDDDAKAFVRFLTKFLTFRGKIEFDSQTQTFVIKDRQNRARLISDFVKLLDNSGFALKELVNEPAFEMN